jgi:DNA end-binding protein Ku
MAPRANWKGYLRLSLVTCPVALFPATSETEKVSFNQINRKTGHRIKYQRVDAETGEDVDNEDIVKGYKVDTDTYIEVTKDELDNIALESNRTIDIDEFVPRDEIDELYVVRPYYLVPDGKVGHDAYAVIRDTIKATNKVAIARVVLTNREHIIALEARDKGLVGLLLRYPYEVRQSSEYFDGIQDVKITKDMLDLAKHIVDQKSGHFEPAKFEDNYETALIDLINQKRAGLPVAKVKVKTEGNVINLMDALRQSLKGKAPAKVLDTEEEEAPAAAKAPAKKANGKGKKPAVSQREMLFALEGKGQKAAKADNRRETAKRPARAPARQKRAG